MVWCSTRNLVWATCKKWFWLIWSHALNMLIRHWAFWFAVAESQYFCLNWAKSTVHRMGHTWGSLKFLTPKEIQFKSTNCSDTQTQGNKMWNASRRCLHIKYIRDFVWKVIVKVKDFRMCVLIFLDYPCYFYSIHLDIPICSVTLSIQAVLCYLYVRVCV